MNGRARLTELAALAQLVADRDIEALRALRDRINGLQASLAATDASVAAAATSAAGGLEAAAAYAGYLRWATAERAAGVAALARARLQEADAIEAAQRSTGRVEALAQLAAAAARGR